MILFAQFAVPPMADCNTKIVCINFTYGIYFQNIAQKLLNEIKKKGHYALVKLKSQSITQIYL